MELIRKENNWAKDYLPEKNYKDTVHYIEKEGVGLLQFTPFIDVKWLTHGFSTRIGGVSEGIYSSMNLSFSRGDDETAVSTNYKRMAAALGVEMDSFTSTKQTHTTIVIEADFGLRGNGVTKPQQLEDVDGFVTSQKDICLVTSYADCVPLYFADMKKRVIGLSHSGWRGTAGNICKSTVDLMKKLYSSNPEDIVTFIGPSICGDCYEVSDDLLEPFGVNMSSEEINKIFIPKTTGKYLLNLQLANVINMKKAGIPSENIYVTDVCTCCNSDILFSHRASKGMRGGLCGFLKLN